MRELVDATVRLLTQDPEALLCTYPSCRCQEVRRLVRQQGLTPEEGIRQACLLRLRPILMTTMAALFGAVPLMLASGSGAELRQPLGLVMVGGLLVSQVLTLFTTPVIYLQLERLFHRTDGSRTPALPASH